MNCACQCMRAGVLLCGVAACMVFYAHIGILARRSPPTLLSLPPSLSLSPSLSLCALSSSTKMCLNQPCHCVRLTRCSMCCSFTYPHIADHVQPVCSPTRSTFMSGRHVIHTGIYMPFPQVGSHLCRSSCVLATFLSSALSRALFLVMETSWRCSMEEARRTHTLPLFTTLHTLLGVSTLHTGHCTLLLRQQLPYFCCAYIRHDRIIRAHC